MLTTLLCAALYGTVGSKIGGMMNSLHIINQFECSDIFGAVSGFIGVLGGLKLADNIFEEKEEE